MRGSIWRFSGDPGRLARSYEAMVAEIPSGQMRLQLCLRRPDGLVLVDTCPSQEAVDAFFAGPSFRAMCRRHGLPEPESVEDFPVQGAFVDGQRRSSAS